MIKKLAITGRVALGLCVGGLLLAYTNGTAAPPASITADLDARIAEGLAKLGAVQGVAVAVYTPDGVYAKGFGVTDIDTGEPVTEDTAFYIASSTKSFTALAMNILHHRGDLDLDAALSDFVPDAGFPAAVNPGEVTLRDFLTHTAGIKNHPIGFRLAFTGQHDPGTLWRLLQSSESNTDAPLGEFQYTNVGYNILTILTDRMLGRPWQDMLAEEIFAPAGMTRTSAYMSKAEHEGWSLARPHTTVGPDAPERIYLEKTDATMQSAGGMIMSAKDALRFLELMIEDGRIGGEQIISAEAVRETRAPYAEVGGSFGEYSRDHYGLGWYLGTYRGDAMVHHFGGFAGARAHVSYLPDRKLGVAVFVNDSEAGFQFADILANYVYDTLNGQEGARARYDENIAAAAAQIKQFSARIAADRENRAAREWTLSLPHTAYAGTYESELGGVLEISLEDEALVVTLGNLHAVAEPFTAPDTIRVELIPGRGEVIGFRKNDSGGIAALRYGDYEFARR